MQKFFVNLGNADGAGNSFRISVMEGKDLGQSGQAFPNQKMSFMIWKADGETAGSCISFAVGDLGELRHALASVSNF